MNMKNANIARQIKGRARSLLISIALFSGAMGFGGVVLAEGGGDPIGSQPIDWAAQRQAERTGRTTDDTRAAQRAAGAVANRSHGNYADQSRGNYADRFRGNYADQSRGYYADQSRGYYRDRGQRNDYRGRRYDGPRYRSFARSEPYYPYYYAPAPLAYDPYPTPGLSLFFNF